MARLDKHGRYIRQIDLYGRLMEKPLPQPGILLTPEFEPVTPTIVFAPNYATYHTFTKRCGIPRPTSRLLFTGQHGSSPLKGLAVAYGRDWFQHVAFVSIDPRRYNPRLHTDEETWFDLENLRMAGSIKRAFYYPDPRAVVPNVQDGGRDWLDTTE